jgi:hypothetical protein
MKRKEFALIPIWLLLVCLGLTLLSSGAAAAGPSEAILYRFQGGQDGFFPAAGLIADAAGNLFGTTSYGGGSTCTLNGFVGCGTVFQLAPPAQKGSAWTETVLYRFQGGADGAYPNGLIRDPAGNLYGTTGAGGQGSCGTFGCGTVFKLVPPAPPIAVWTKTVLYTFQGGSDGFQPNGSLIADRAGDFYGVTLYGGPAHCLDCGTVFKLRRPPEPGGAWTKSVLYTFQGAPDRDGDGQNPLGLALDNQGNLYGTTASGGLCQHFEGGTCFGAVFKLTPPTQHGGAWSENVLHRFDQSEQNPVSAPVVNQAGTVYGTTYLTVFQVVGSTETVLHTFTGGSDGYLPYGGVILDQAGNLDGTTIGGGQVSGVVFRLQRPPSGGSWTETILHDFAGSPDGESPDAPLLLNKGILYGTTLRGGNHGCQVYPGDVGCGTVFQVVP